MKIHQINGYIQTLYLVEDKDDLVLLDSGCRSDVERVRKFIEVNLKREMSDLKLVLVSHAHPDHSGGAYLYQQKYHIKIASSSVINNWYSGVIGWFTYLVDIGLTYLVAWRKNKGFENIIFPRSLSIDIELMPDEEIPLLEGWKVLSTPGHTNFDLSFLHIPTKTAYIADNIVGSSGKYFRPYPLVSPQKYKKSLQRYIDLDINHYLLAHHGKNEIDNKVIKSLIDTTPKQPRIHRKSLIVILKHVLKGKKKS